MTSQLHANLKLCVPVMQMLQTVVPEELGENGAAAGVDAPLDRQRLLYCERFVELLIDLLSQLPTRRFVRTLLEDRAILIKARMSPLFFHPEGACLSAGCSPFPPA